MTNLDKSSLYAVFDPDDMLGTIRDLPEQVESAWEVAQEAPLPEDYKEIRRIIVGGMGGSAIGADLLGGLMAREGTVPLEVVRGYELPAYVGGEDTLFVASSYSGNTEETLSLFDKAHERGTRLLAVTTGGKVADRAEAWDVPVWRFAYESTPRAALGYSFTLLVALASRLDLLPNLPAAIKESVEELVALQPNLVPDVPTDENAAKQLASKLSGKIPAVFGSGFLTAVARRWKTQANENAKQWGIWDEIPELNHNAVVGFGQPESVTPHLAAVLLRSNLDHPRVQVRWEVTKELLTRANVLAYQVYGRGESPLAQMLTLIHFGDFVSYYLAALNEADPTPVETIAYLKERLADVE